ncbi:MAG: complex I NDUFA9 subunit family protein [Candidatus Symbiobacter sp.]|nr:complex I NDUFA9 subunit family protein [Candidatus Symbiobacter sp.]
MTLQKITLFGGSGFVGRHIIRRLAATGAMITIVTRNSEHAKFLRPMGNVGQIGIVSQSLTDEDGLVRILTEQDAVINLVAILSEAKRGEFQSIHVDWPTRLGRLAKVAGVKKLIHLSALGARRDHPSAYSRSRAAGEEALLHHFPAALILRPSLIFGPEDQLFNLFAPLAAVMPIFPIVSSRAQFQPIYVGDVADAVMRVLALRQGEAKEPIFALGGPQIYTWREMMEAMLWAMGRDRRPHRPIILTIPFGLAVLGARLFGGLPRLIGRPGVTSDQILLLSQDNVVPPKSQNLADLGLTGTALTTILPQYLGRLRPGGRFAAFHKI